MSSFLIVLLLAVPLVGVLGATAYALDLCLTFDLFTLVVKDVTNAGKNDPPEKLLEKMNKEVAKANQCRQLSGFYGPGSSAFANVSLCTDSTGSNATVIATGYTFISQSRFPLPIPTSSGTSDIWFVTNGSGDEDLGTTVGVCVPPDIPVP
jgi:hypothetical protein